MGDLSILFLRGFYLTKAEQLKRLLSDHAVTNSDDFKEELLSAARDGVLEPWCKKRGLQLTGVNLKDTNNSLYEALVKAVTGLKEFKATNKAFVGNFAEALKEEDVKYDEESKTLKISIRPIKPTNERFEFEMKTKGGKSLASSGKIDWNDKTKNSPVSHTFNLKKMPEEDDAVLFVNGTEQIRAIETSKPKRTFSVNGVDFNMILVRKGTFMMGATPEQNNAPDSDEKPAHQVTLSKNYYIGETVVTQALWEAVMLVHRSSFSGEQRPVGNVSWTECQIFIRKLNDLTGMTFRLPTEAEWEFAARGGNKSMHHEYAGSNRIDDVGWYASNSNYYNITRPSCLKQPNELGIYDMSGNVREWCNDWYEEYSSEAQTDPQGPSQGKYRVTRGGSFNNWSRYCRVSSRNYDVPSTENNEVGFRLALTL